MLAEKCQLAAKLTATVERRLVLAALVCDVAVKLSVLWISDVALTKLCLCVKCISAVFKLLYFHLFSVEFFTKCKSGELQQGAECS